MYRLFKADPKNRPPGLHRAGCSDFVARQGANDLMRATVAASRDGMSATMRCTVRSKSARSLMPLGACVERAGTSTVFTGTLLLLSFMAPPSSHNPWIKYDRK